MMKRHGNPRIVHSGSFRQSNAVILRCSNLDLDVHTNDRVLLVSE